MMDRRKVIKDLVLTSCYSPVAVHTGKSHKRLETRYSDLDKIINTRVLDTSFLREPVIIDKLELLRYRDNFICRVISKSGAVGLSIGNNMQLISLYPIFTHRLQPFFIGKDARNLESLLEELYVYKSNYKLQNLALWVPIATIEFAILDLLGKLGNKTISEILQKRQRDEIEVYQANNYRGKSAEESLEHIIRNVEKHGAKALKFKVGGRMSKNADFPPHRTERLVPLVRKQFGPQMTIYADSNGSYDTQEAVRIGKLMEVHQYDMYEEPVPFDWYEETKSVSDTLRIPIAGGEQEASMHNFRWLIGNDALDIVQPDIFYFGGMIRSLKVALMAEARGKLCVPHISGSGLGYLYMMHFVSILKNAGPYHEFKGFNSEIPIECETSDLRTHDGTIRVPSGPGLGAVIDPDFVSKHESL